MASKITLDYLGNLRTEMQHARSGERIISDAPVDNHGKGEAFSPTDLVAAAMISCMVTVMGIAAEARGWEMGSISGEVEKFMASNPRRIEKLAITIRIQNSPLSEDQKNLLESVALNCPVAKSVHPDMIYETEFVYS